MENGLLRGGTTNGSYDDVMRWYDCVRWQHPLLLQEEPRSCKMNERQKEVTGVQIPKGIDDASPSDLEPVGRPGAGFISYICLLGPGPAS